MLKQLRETKHGSANIDDADVPENLRSTVVPPKDEWDVDGLHEERYNWVLDEMIWTFKQLTSDEKEEDNFRSGEIDQLWQALDIDHNPIGEPQKLGDREKHDGVEFYTMVDGPNHTYKVDYDGLKVYHKRIDNGLLLFGKYYRTLWD
jgi:hypothetical protein